MVQRKYTEEEARLRKNERQREYARKTGYTANARYNKRAYGKIVLNVRKEVAEAYRKKCNQMGVPYNLPMREAIENFLKK